VNEKMSFLQYNKRSTIAKGGTTGGIGILDEGT
jgi:hypothetical protein